MRRIAGTCMAAMLWSALAQPVDASVRVVEEEVVFILRAPGATDVYLVGSFNNWNPTVERMQRDGETFEISLFLVAGTYYYKFVIDGEAQMDPDNPGRDPDRGSPLTLLERSGGLALSTEVVEDGVLAPSLIPALRYIGQWTAGRDGSATEDTNRVDVTATFRRDRIFGEAIVRVRETTGSKGSVDTDVDRAFVDARLGSLRMRGYANDTTWVSTDPAAVVGKEGVFAYNSGFDRHGVSAGIEKSKFFVRALHDDRTTRAHNAPFWPDSAIGADTTLYFYRPTTGDADRTAVETSLQGRTVGLGWTWRREAGLHPGARLDLAADSSLTSSSATREETRAWFLWASYRAGWGIEFRAGAGDASLGVGGFEGLVDSRRVIVSASGDGQRPWRMEWDHTAFDLGDETRADVDRVRGRISFEVRGSPLDLSIEWTQQLYRDTPGALHIDSPERNPWLGMRDGFDAVAIAGLDMLEHICYRASWRLREYLQVSAGLLTDGIDGGVVHAWADAGVGFPLPRRLFAELDGRVASYDKASWGVARSTFVSGYAEAGWRSRFVELNVGYGFDPVVFDPVLNEFHRIGWTRAIRDALENPVRREDAAAIGRRLLDREKAMEAGRFKVECIVRF